MRSEIAKLLALASLVYFCAGIQPVHVRAGLASNAANDSDEKITITRANAVPSNQGPVEHFSGSVRLDMLTEPKEPGKPRVESITFAAGGHTAWHSHPLGQILVVTSGSGIIQQWGGPVQQIHQGDVIWTPANVKHWHGAGPHGPMTHISVYEEPSGQVTKWMEKVTDGQYRAAY